MRTLLALATLGLLLLTPFALAHHGDDDIPLTCLPEDPYPCWCAHDVVRCVTHPRPIEPCRVGDQYIC